MRMAKSGLSLVVGVQAAMVVDVDHPRNREEVAYSDIELKMARLESLVEIQPRCLSQFEELYR